MLGIKRNLLRLKKVFDKKAIVLMYHSISEPDIDPWELAVSTSNFEQQLAVLQNTFNTVFVSDITSNLRKGQLKTKTVALTFDDGYRNNFETATPLLEKYNIRATFFLTNNFGEGKIYWWDRLANFILRTPVLPDKFDMVLKENTINFSIREECVLNDQLEQLHRNWVMPANPPTKRSELFYKLWQIMRPLPPIDIEDALYSIKKFIGITEETHFPETLLVTKNQLQALANHQFIEFGIHTANHVSLSSHTAEVQEDEILQNKNLLETGLYKKISTIAYPYGEYNNITLDVVKRSGLQGGFTVEPNAITTRSNPFELGRFQVKNWNAKQFEDKLAQWMKL